MDRERRRGLAEETVKILEAGHYQAADGTQVSIKREMERCMAGTRLYRSEDIGALGVRIADRRQCYETEILVTNETTLAAARRELNGGKEEVCCLNFASAKNPGGGFLGGSEAQEESLARASGLYFSLLKAPEYYEHNRGHKTALYSDYMIYSPHVPVFREESGQLLGEHYCVSMITAPAVNAGALMRNEPRSADRIVPVMRKRTKQVLMVAAAHECTVLILGAWGCGVFENDPRVVAGIFKEMINEDDCRGVFKRIVFAVYDRSREQATFNAFRNCFEGRAGKS